jgi:4-amino-4-deoxy-L-arabinose transferase-like glycosyltransferase
MSQPSAHNSPPPSAGAPSEHGPRAGGVGGLEKHAGIVLAVAASALMLLALNNVDFWDEDEPRYAQVAREMVDGGDYILMHHNGARYAEKPPLFFWMIAACAQLTGGVNEISARMPSAVAGVAAVLMTFALAKRMFGARAGLLAGMVLLGSAYFVAHARTVHMDMPLAFFTTAMIFAFYVAFERGKAAWWTWPVFFLAGVGGIMMKGPAGFLPSLIACAAFSLLRRDWRAWRSLSCLLSALVAVALIGAWLAALGQRSNSHFISQTLIGQTLERITGAKGHVHPFYYFLGAFPGVFLPWTPFFILSLVMAAGRTARRAEAAWKILFVLAWFAAIFILFSAIPSKRKLYILPAFPSAAIVVAWFMDEIISGRADKRLEAAARWLGAALLALAAAATPLALAFLAWGNIRYNDSFAAVIDGLRRNYADVIFLGIAVCALGVFGALALLRRHWAGGAAAMLLMCVTVAAATAFVFFPLNNSANSAKDFSTKLNEAAGGCRLAAFPQVPEGILYYSGQKFQVFQTPQKAAAFLNGGNGEARFCLADAKHAEELKAAYADSEKPEEVLRGEVDGDEIILLRSRITTGQPGPP